MRIRVATTLLTVTLLASHDASAGRSFRDFPALADMGRTTLRNTEGDRLDIIGYMGPQRRPAMVVIPGSLCAPVFVALDGRAPGDGFTTVPLLAAADGNELGVNVVYLERRNMVSLKTLASLPRFSVDAVTSGSPCTDRNGGVTLEQRVADALVQIRWLKAQPWVSSIHLVGVSEGGDVAAGAAAAPGSPVSSLLLIGSAGPTQFADFVAAARKRGDLKGVQAAFADLDHFLKGTAPHSYKGYSARRWQSFALANSSLASLRKSDVPVFIAHGGRDESVPVSSADLAVVELMIDQPRRPIYYWAVKDGDHALVTPSGSRMWNVIRDYLAWAKSGPSGRKIRAD
ncbi:alpha/beta hydrolase family protein [Lysobacter xanthus]